MTAISSVELLGRFAARQKVAQNTAMAKTASELTRASTQEGAMEFEQPLSERMRTFLRIEFLYQQQQRNSRRRLPVYSETLCFHAVRECS